jgi:hypothetical protein
MWFHRGQSRKRRETDIMPCVGHRALLLAPPLLALAVSVHAAPVPPASFVSSEDAPPPPALPADPSPITDHMALAALFYWGRVSTTGQFDGGTGGTSVIGTPLSAERDLGLTNQAYQPRIEILFRLASRSRLRVNFFDLRRNGSTVLNNTIQYGDQTFLVGQPLQSTINWRQMDLTYTYSFLRGERYELGAGLGAHLLEAEAIAQVPSSPQRVDYSQAGPFATVALDGTYLIARHWSFNARANYMHLTVHDFTGQLEDYHADVQYRWRRNFAVGVGYDYSKAEVDVRDQDPSGFVQLRISGPQLFLRVSY